MTIEAELFAIRCRINQAIQISGVSHIIIITDVLYVTKKIFDPTIYPYQIQSIVISEDLQNFFRENFSEKMNNSVKFWNLLWDTLDINNFILFYFSDFIFIFIFIFL